MGASDTQVGIQVCNPSDQAQPKIHHHPVSSGWSFLTPVKLQPLFHPRHVRGLCWPCSRPGTQLPNFSLTLSVLCSNGAWIKSRTAQIPILPILPPKLLLYKISLTNWWKHYGFQKGYSWLRVKTATNATLHSAAAKNICVSIFQ